ncbi:hypothetical protein HNY73_016072 [Argiope bruennichi]|uniref:Uncharacterized protein n=1 Tax=Argiope bruennichi TaxID=94029 RepID=A0A8T0EHN3_ARGBR|nr:hypothetical protein HNY73_016072 [Argiope bruennichi]
MRKDYKNLLAEVFTDEESLNEEDEEIVDEELISDHYRFREELDSDSEVYVCESTDDYVGKERTQCESTIMYNNNTSLYVRKD